MWHSATAAAVALIQYHLLVDAFGGLGGVIVIIVGGIVSAIAIRNARRSVAPPAAHPQPAPPSRRREPPVSYGEPAPPTIPSRRLYPGPIAPPPTQESAPQKSGSPAPQDGEPANSLFNPDIFGPVAQRDPTSEAATGTRVKRAELPLLGVDGPGDAERRAQARLMAAPGQHASVPLWSQPPTRHDETANVQAAQARFSAAALPVWGDGSPLAPVTGAVQDASPAGAEASTTPAAQVPVWDMPRGSMAGARETPDEAEAGARASIPGVSAEPPIWGSSSRLPSE